MKKPPGEDWDEIDSGEGFLAEPVPRIIAGVIVLVTLIFLGLWVKSFLA